MMYSANRFSPLWSSGNNCQIIIQEIAKILKCLRMTQRPGRFYHRFDGCQNSPGGTTGSNLEYHSV